MEDLPARDRLPRWLYRRYGAGRKPWEHLDRGERIQWQEEADDVVRAVVELTVYELVKG